MGWEPEVGKLYWIRLKSAHHVETVLPVRVVDFLRRPRVIVTHEGSEDSRFIVSIRSLHREEQTAVRSALGKMRRRAETLQAATQFIQQHIVQLEARLERGNEHKRGQNDQ